MATILLLQHHYDQDQSAGQQCAGWLHPPRGSRGLVAGERGVGGEWRDGNGFLDARQWTVAAGGYQRRQKRDPLGQRSCDWQRLARFYEWHLSRLAAG